MRDRLYGTARFSNEAPPGRPAKPARQTSAALLAAGLMALLCAVPLRAGADSMTHSQALPRLGYRVVPGPLPPDPQAATPPLLTQMDLVYFEVAGVPLRMDFAKPATCQWQSVPVVVFIHGGAWRGGDKEDGLTRPESRMLFQLGFAVATINYRLVPTTLFPGMIEDCKRAIRYLRVNAEALGIDPDRIGVYGTSAGGHLAALAGLANDGDGLEGDGLPGVSSRVSCVVEYFGPTDFSAAAYFENWEMIQAIIDMLGCQPENCVELALQASPVTYVNAGDPPFLILHGDHDGSVPYAQSRKLALRCRNAGVPCALIKVLNADHGFTPFPPDAVIQPSLREIWRMNVAHMARYLEPTCYGDLNLDGRVDMVDAMEIIHLDGSMGVGPLGEPAPADWNPLADLNADSHIDSIDLALFLQHRLATE